MLELRVRQLRLHRSPLRLEAPITQNLSDNHNCHVGALLDLLRHADHLLLARDLLRLLHAFFQCLI